VHTDWEFLATTVRFVAHRADHPLPDNFGGREEKITQQYYNTFQQGS